MENGKVVISKADFDFKSLYDLGAKRDFGIAMRFGKNTDRFDVIENLRNPSCDMYWNIRCEEHHANILAQSYQVFFYVNNSWTFTDHLEDFPYNPAIMKGSLNITHLPACYTLRSSLLNG